MTNIHLFNQYNLNFNNTQWEEFTTNNIKLFNKINSKLNLLKIKNFKPRIKINNFIYQNVILLKVEINQKDLEILNNLNNITSKIKLSNNFANKSWHITLAYQYKAISVRELRILKLGLENFLNNLIQDQDREIYLDLPKLCYFSDMTKFTNTNL